MQTIFGIRYKNILVGALVTVFILAGAFMSTTRAEAQVVSESVASISDTSKDAQIAALMALLQELIKVYTELLAAQGQTPDFEDEEEEVGVEVDVDVVEPLSDKDASLKIISKSPSNGKIKAQLFLPKKYDGYFVHFLTNPSGVPKSGAKSGSLYGTTYRYNHTNPGPLTVELDVTEAHEGFANNPGGVHWFSLPSGKYSLVAVVYPKSPFKPGTDMEFLPVGKEPGAVLIINTPYTFEDTDDQSEVETISVELDDSDARLQDKGIRFTVDLEISANDNDVYINEDVMDAFTYRIVRDETTVTMETNSVHVLSSSADEVDGFYEIQEGDEESFTLEVAYNPTKNGQYRLYVDSVAFKIGTPNGGSYNNTQLVYEGIKTDSIYWSSYEKDESEEPTMTLVVSPETVLPNQAVTLTWSSKNTTYCTMGDKMDTKGAMILGPLSETKTYTIQCVGNGGVVSKSVTVKVTDYEEDDMSDVAPKMNIMSCAYPLKTGLANGALACYGVWDYGDDFGNDQNMCGADGTIGNHYSNAGTKCKLPTTACSSGTAYASQSIKISSATSGTVKDIANRLLVTPDVLRAGMAHIWEYTCVDPLDPLKG